MRTLPISRALRTESTSVTTSLATWIALAIPVLLTACNATAPKLSGNPPASAPTIVAGGAQSVPSSTPASTQTVTGAAGGSTAVNASSSLERCDRPLGVLRIEEDTGSTWYRTYASKLGSTAPVLNMLIMQSNCFVVVERGTGERSISDETGRGRGVEARESGTRGTGQQVTADFLLKPEITMLDRNSEGMNVGGKLGKVLGAVNMHTGEAGAMLTLVDIRSTVRISAAQGFSKKSNFSFGGGAGGGGGGLGGTAYSRSDEGKLVVAAFADSFNQMVVALRNYKAQVVKGGLGEGGELGVQGGSTQASKAVDRAAARPATDKAKK